MKILIQKKEIIDFIIAQSTKILSTNEYNIIYNIQPLTDNLDSVLAWAHEKKTVKKLEKFKDKLKSKLERSITTDLRAYVDAVVSQLNTFKEVKATQILKKPDYIIEKIGINQIVELYRASDTPSFTKSIGQLINSNAKLVLDSASINPTDDCVIRNMAGNESLLLEKMHSHYPFWFIDTGYTNFLNSKRKTWHRLTRNHLHHFQIFDAPLDRLHNFESFPKQWRESGHKILVIEPGEFSANTFNIDINKWKVDVETELRNYTDKPIVFREKLSKKIRKNLYHELLDEDYHCIVNINSNAAVESLWAGIPVITLHKHISNCVSSNQLSSVNNLYKPNLANWVCMLSYSQFTYDEIINGTALNIVRKYHV